MPQPWKFKPGQWVVVDGRVGILYAPGADDSEIHFVDENRQTIAVEVVSNGTIQRARFQDLPEQARRDMEETDATHGAKRGGTFGARNGDGDQPTGGAVTEGPR